MSLRDDLIVDYFDLLTDVESGEIQEMGRAMEAEAVNPMELKKRLARDIVGQFHSAEAAREAEAHFERVVQRGEAPEEMAPVDLGDIAQKSLSHVLVAANLAASVGQAKRLIKQGAVEINGQKIAADYVAEDLKPGDMLRAGKRRFVRIVAGGAS